MSRFSILIPVYEEQPHFGSTPIGYKHAQIAKFEASLVNYKPTRENCEQLHVAAEQGITRWRIMKRYDFALPENGEADALAGVVKVALEAFKLPGVLVGGPYGEKFWTADTLKDVEAGIEV